MAGVSGPGAFEILALQKKCAHKSISPFCLMYQWSQCSLCWSGARHCHDSNIPSHNWVCLSCKARWWPMMGSPQDNLWRRSLNSLHITALYLSEVTYEGFPQGALWKKLSRQVHKVYNHCNHQKTSLSSHHVDSPAMFFVDSCWGKIDKSSKQESVVSSHHPLNTSYTLLWGDFLHRIHGMRRITLIMIVQ